MEKSSQVRKWKRRGRIKGKKPNLQRRGLCDHWCHMSAVRRISTPFVWEERCFLGLFCVAWGHPTQTIYFVLCGVGSPHTDDLFRSVWGRITPHRRKYFIIFLYYFSLTFSKIQALMKTKFTFIILSDSQFIAYHTYCFSQSLQVGII
jgi:hypothetical protein